MPEVRFLYFAGVRERIGCDAEQVVVPVEGSDRSLLDLVAARHPLVAPLLKPCRIAVNHAFVRGAVTLAEGAEVAVIPPVSGG